MPAGATAQQQDVGAMPYAVDALLGCEPCEPTLQRRTRPTRVGLSAACNPIPCTLTTPSCSLWGGEACCQYPTGVTGSQGILASGRVENSQGQRWGRAPS